MEPNNTEVIVKERFGWLKIIFFFILGTSGLIASIIAAAWIFFRTKIRKQHKYYAVAAGLVFSIVGSFALQQFIFYQAPETKEIKAVVGEILPSGRTTIGLSTTYTTTSEGSYVTKALTINHISRNWLSASDTQKVAVAACEIIEKSGKEYDGVSVVSNRSAAYPLTIPFYHAALSAGFPCTSWTSEEALDQIERLNAMMNNF